MGKEKLLFDSKIIGMKRLCFIFLALLTLSSCSYTGYTGYVVGNNYQLKHTASTLNPAGSEISSQYYQDEYLTIELLQVTQSGIYLTLANNHNSTIRVLWDEAAFVDFDSFSHRINHDNNSISKKLSKGLSVTSSSKSTFFSTHSGAAVIIDEGKVQIPSVIPAGTRVNTVIIPTDDASIIRFANLRTMDIADEKTANAILQKYQARTAETAIKLLLPIEVDGKKIEYTATFADEFQTYRTERGDLEPPVLIVPVAIIALIPLLCI